MKLKIIETVVKDAGKKLTTSYGKYKPAKLKSSGMEKVFAERNLTLYVGAELIKNKFSVFAEHYFPEKDGVGFLDMLALKAKVDSSLKCNR